ncbi:MAG TPA: AMP-binding protein [Rubrobacteraceae bacterium]|nr:AMP-binding protein [Rubrobacteraceae bacterium]
MTTVEKEYEHASGRPTRLGQSKMRDPLTKSYWPADTSAPIVEWTVREALRRAAAEAPGTTALVAGTPNPTERRRWTYADLLGQAERAARALLGRFDPGDRVAIWANNIPEWVVLEYAAALAGITIVTVNPALRAGELRHVLGHSRADGVFLIPEYRGSPMAEILTGVRADLPNLREAISFSDWNTFLSEASPTQALPEVSPDDPAQIQYTSGTTGKPKGAVLRHRSILNNARFYAERFGMPIGGVQMSPMPLFHTAGCVLSVLGSLSRRGTLVLAPFFDPGLCLELVEGEGVDSLMGVPTMLIGLLGYPLFPETNLSRVERVLSGGATVPPDLVRRVEEKFGAPVSIVFAQTETSPVITQTSPEDAPEDRAETLGRPLPQTEVRIVDPESGETVPPGHIGEICTRGYHVMAGYFDDPEATAAAIDRDGWLRTGDLGSMDGRGYCRIEGRLKDVIIRGGENVYPREIEQVLFAREDVADVAVVGVHDETWGEQIAAFVRPTAGHTPSEEELFAYCRERLAPHKTPRHWVFVEEFPLTASGKVQKFVLRERFASEGANQRAGAAR